MALKSTKTVWFFLNFPFCTVKRHLFTYLGHEHIDQYKAVLSRNTLHMMIAILYIDKITT